jgi:valyl-tRNA synthetase
MTSSRQARLTLLYCLDTSLRVLHPFMPYISEALWQQLPPRNGGGAAAGESAAAVAAASLMVSDWPQLETAALFHAEARRRDNALRVMTVMTVCGGWRRRRRSA